MNESAAGRTLTKVNICIERKRAEPNQMKEKIVKWFIKNRPYPQSPYEAKRLAEKFIEELEIK